MASMMSILSSLSVFKKRSITKATPIHFINGKCDIKFNESQATGYLAPEGLHELV